MNKNNYQSEMSENLEQKALDNLYYNAVIYLPLHRIEAINGMTVNQIIKELGDMKISEEDKTAVDEVKVIIENNPEQNYEDVKVDHYSKGYGFDPRAISAAVFKKDGQNTIVYRGTPGGAWVDNSDTLNGVSKQQAQEICDALGVDMEIFQYLSDIDVMTLQYFKEVTAKYGNGNLEISGHSKGGHEAMLVALLYPELYSKCYAFDGQGVPPEIWKELEKLYGSEKLQEIRNQILGFNVNDDYVHPLGWTEEYGYIPGFLYIITGNEMCLENPGANHFLSAFLTDGKLNPINLAGEGALAKLLMALSNEIMKRDPEDRKVVTDAIMLICQRLIGVQGPVGMTGWDEVDLLWNSRKGFGEAWDIIKNVIADPEMNQELQKYIRDLDMNEKLEDGIIEFIKSYERNPNISLGEVLKGMIVTFAIEFLKGKASEFIHKMKESLKNAANWISQQADKLLDTLKKGIQQLSQMKDAAIKRLSELAEKATDYVKNLASEVKNFFKTIQTEVKNFTDWAVDGLKSFTQEWKGKIAEAAKTLQNTFAEIAGHAGKKAGELRQRVREISEERKKIADYFRDINSRIALFIDPANQFREQVIERAKMALGWAEKAGDAVTEAADQIKDSIDQGISVLQESMNRFGQWMKEKITIGSLKDQLSLGSGLSGVSGIDYSALSQVQMLISQYVDDTQKIALQINDVMEDLSRLRYASINTGSFSSAKRLIEKQGSVMEDHIGQLESYRKVCEDGEREIIHMLCAPC